MHKIDHHSKSACAEHLEWWGRTKRRIRDPLLSADFKMLTEATQRIERIEALKEHSQHNKEELHRLRVLKKSLMCDISAKRANWAERKRLSLVK